MFTRSVGLLLFVVFVAACDDTPGNGPAPDGATVDATLGDAPVTDAPAADAPAADAPAADAPTFDAPAVDAPLGDAPVTNLDATPRCASHADCSGSTRYCLRATATCVQCVNATQCGSGSVCSLGRCVPAVACTSTRMCPDQVCDVTAGRCVDCVADVDCPTGQACARGVCDLPAPPCRSSRECSGNGQVCHATRAVCVDCNVDADCATGQRCSAEGACAATTPTTCTPGAASCADATTRRVCNADGRSYASAACPTMQGCAAGACVPFRCTPGAATCAGASTRSVCDPDGQGSTTTPCPAAQVCMGGVCRALTCTPGAASCTSTTMRSVCNADGLGTTDTVCASGETCAGGVCSRVTSGGACAAGTFFCDVAGVRRQCNADGMTSAAAPCPSAQVCASGACLDASADRCPGIDVPTDGSPFVYTPTGLSPTLDLGVACPTRGFSGPYTDAVLHFRLGAARDVTLSLTSTAQVQVQLQDSCVPGVMRASSIGNCAYVTAPHSFRYRNLPAGDYYVVILFGSPPSPVTVTVSTSDPASRAPGDGCLTAVAVTPDGPPGTLVGVSGFDAFGESVTTCGTRVAYVSNTDWFWRFRNDSVRDVTLTMSGATGAARFQVYTGCGASARPVGACSPGVPLRLRQLPVGDYVVVGHGSTQPAGASISLAVTTSSPALQPVGDSCARPAELTLDGPAVPVRLMTLASAPDLGVRFGSLSATGTIGIDAVWHFNLASRATVQVTMTGVTGAAWQLQSACARGAGLVLGRQSAGTPATFVNLPAGDYYIVAEHYSSTSPSTTDMISMQLRAATAPASTAGDTCDSPITLTPDGPAVSVTPATMFGRYRQMESLCLNGTDGYDYALRFTLSAPHDVTIQVGGTAGAVFELQTRCGAPTTTLSNCRSAGGSATTFSTSYPSLPAGTYFLVARTASTATATQNVTFTVTTGDAGALPYTYYWTREPLAVGDFISACDAPGRVALLSNQSDNTAVVPAPFDLRVWGATLGAGRNVAVVTNGLLSLDYPFPTSSTMTPTLPTTIGPNFLVAPLWVQETDYGRGVCAAALGAAPNRRWVIEWEDAGFYTGSSRPSTRNRYEAILYEGQRDIEFLYDVLDLRTYDPSNGSINIPTHVVGLESRDGTAGLSLGTPEPRTRVRLSPSR